LVEIEGAEACLALATASAREFEVTHLESSAAMTAQTQGTDICRIYVIYKWYMYVSFMNGMWIYICHLTMVRVREFEVTRQESSAAMTAQTQGTDICSIKLVYICVFHEWYVDIHMSFNNGSCARV